MGQGHPAVLQRATGTATAEDRSAGRPAPSPDGEKTAIPPLVHFCWLGGRMKDAALRNIVQWAEQAKTSGWKILIWTTPDTDWGTAFTPLVGKLRMGSIERKNIEDGLDERVESAYRAALAAKDYPAASDLARYGILHKHGGVYADVDLGIGQVKLHEDVPRLSVGDVPVLGPQLRDKRSRDAALKDANLDKLELSEGEKTGAAAEHYLKSGQFGNHFFAVQQGSVAMDRIIKQVALMNEGATEGDFGTGDAAVRTGPNPMLKALVDYQMETKGDYDPSTLQPEGADALHQKVNWLTEESENQDYERH
ncbi:glycosyltransferase [Streptomyces mutabilis]|uniref:glycosyltransferase n=1 Tax=Streptomyces mutabilis TaxID=67332 RepID=UPI00177F91F5|nr:glycosyltransferase [Streptomyces mutabilis]